MMHGWNLGSLALLAALLGATPARAIEGPERPAEALSVPEQASVRVLAARALAEASAERYRTAQAERDRLRAELEAASRRLTAARSEFVRTRQALDVSARRSLERREIVAAGLLHGLRRARSGTTATGPWPSPPLSVSWLSDLQVASEAASAALREHASRLEREVEAVAVALATLESALDRAEAHVEASRAELFQAAVRLEEAERRRVAVRSAFDREAEAVAERGGRALAASPPEAADGPLKSSGESAGGQRFRLPLRGSIAQRFGERRSGQRSRGLVLSADRPQPIVAPGDGVVAYAGPFRDLGLLLIIEHRDAYHSLVIGASRLAVQVGDVVTEGQAIGWLDRGPSGGMDLYVELRRVGEPVDPLSVLSANEGEVRS